MAMSFYQLKSIISALFILYLVCTKCLQLKNSSAKTELYSNSLESRVNLHSARKSDSNGHEKLHTQINISSLETDHPSLSEPLDNRMNQGRHSGRQQRHLPEYPGNNDKRYPRPKLTSSMSQRQIHPFESRGGIRDNRISRWKMFLMGLGRVNKMSKLLIQLSRKMSYRSLKNFRMLKANLKKVLLFLDQSRNKTLEAEATQWAKTQTTLHDHRTSRGPGMKRSAHGSPLICPDDFVGGGSWPSCYKLAPIQGNWYEAWSYCRSLGAELLSMETLREAYIIDHVIRYYGGINSDSNIRRHKKMDHQNHYLYQYPPSGTNDFGYWTSATIAGKDQKWMWTSGNQLRPIAYSRWQPGKPDSSLSGRCMIISGHSDSNWSNAHCHNGHRIICENSVS